MRRFCLVNLVLLASCTRGFENSFEIVQIMSEGKWDYLGYETSCTYPVSFEFSVDYTEMFAYRHNGHFAENGKPRDVNVYKIAEIRKKEIDMYLQGELGVDGLGVPYKDTVSLLTNGKICWKNDYGICGEPMSECTN